MNDKKALPVDRKVIKVSFGEEKKSLYITMSMFS